MFSFFKRKRPEPPPQIAAQAGAGQAPEAAPTVQAPAAPAVPAAPATPSVPAPGAAAPATGASGGSLIGSALVAPIDVLQPQAAQPEQAAPAERAKWLGRLRAGLRKTGSSISTVFTGARIDEALYDDLEEALLLADTGVQATGQLLTEVRRRVKDSGATHPVQAKNILIDALTRLLRPLDKQLVIGEHEPTVIMVAGVNGAGKTTSIGKLTKHLSDAGESVLLAAADTFRAAAREQLGVWADRNTVEIVSQEGGDPAAVAFDAVRAGRARGRDVVLVDT
ncbi:MAG: signal recognition particle receptor subunit alpha, partial [Proteobacteria bacterium]|nr:signal recognition particle receptor subunit alpha [Pseudomonadota bacterium]